MESASTPTRSEDRLGVRERQVVFVTGKGGVGKTTVAAALGLLSARAGHRTIVCEVGTQTRLPGLYGVGARPGEQQLADGLWTISIDPDLAMREWLMTHLKSGPVVGALARSNLFQYFVAAAPGAREIVTVTKIWELALAKRWARHAEAYDRVIVDLPASGHGIGLLRTPRTFSDIAAVGPVGGQAKAARELIEDVDRTALVAVTLAEELPVSETLDLQARAVTELHRGVDAIVVNALTPSRWSRAELESLSAPGAAVPLGAIRAAHTEAGRAREQQSQLRRLRRGVSAPVVTLGRLTTSTVGLGAVTELSAELERRL